MQTIQIVLDDQLLRAADQAAKKTRRNRSALFRDALREHLRKLEIKAQEEQDRAGYVKSKAGSRESSAWEREAVWPAE